MNKYKNNKKDMTIKFLEYNIKIDIPAMAELNKPLELYCKINDKKYIIRINFIEEKEGD
ncbi:hypothetical protein [Desulfurella sp.]|uniref:hypothetical protein n=1 Tax=Desulfurella sp. TaxID=1962857 RepID=UPI0025BB00F0|nr:hypothetical protein [Desulfurella sp.]